VHIFKVGGTEKARITSYSRTTSYVVVTADQTATQSNTTLQSVTDLVFPLEASKQYLVKAYLHFLGANTTHDIKMGWTVPASCDMKWGAPLQYSATLGAFINQWSPVLVGATPDALLEESATLSIGSAAITQGLIFYGIVTNSTNAGNLQFQFSQDASSAADLKILKGSLLEITKLQ